MAHHLFFFHHDRKVVVVGAGYIAVEMAGILKSLGSEVHQLIRYDHVLRSFDDSVSKAVTEEMRHMGIDLVTNSHVRYDTACSTTVRFES